MASLFSRRGLSAIYFLLAILLFLLSNTIYHLEKAPSVAIGTTEKVVFTPGVDSLTPKTPVFFGENVQLGFDLRVSTKPRQKENSIDDTNTIRKRDDLDWDQALVQGLKSLVSLGGSRQQSQWTTVERLKDRGWSVSDSLDDSLTIDYDGKPSPYEVLSIDRTKGHRIRVEQNKYYDTCSHKRNAPTYGYFLNIYNVPGNAIVAVNNISPINKLSKEDTDDEDPRPPWKERIPEITYWSEVTGIMWFNQAGDQAGALKYVFRYHIITDDTKRIMNLAIARYPESGAVINSEPDPDTGTGFKKPWPGVEIKQGEPSFQALLGTPHAKGVVQLIISNPDKLPNKNIKTITMFTSGDYNDYNLLFTLTD